jgi:RNA polymerase sigma factor (sigma-70 family)
MESLSGQRAAFDGADRERDLPDPNTDPESEAARREFLTALRRAMANLLPRDRLVLRLRFEQDLSLEEIADLMHLGTPLKAQRCVQKALAKTRDELLVQGVSSVSVKGK